MIHGLKLKKSTEMFGLHHKNVLREHAKLFETFFFFEKTQKCLVESNTTSTYTSSSTIFDFQSTYFIVINHFLFNN